MEKSEQTKEVALEAIITETVKVPGVKVDREQFLAEYFIKEEIDINEILLYGPVKAGIPRERLSKIASQLILKRTSQSSLTSFVAGIPGGLAMAATIPADVMQFFGVALRLAQELSYIYGAEDLWDDEKLNVDKVKSQLILYCGVMFGVSGAVSGVRVLSTQFSKVALQQIPKKALTKTFWYPIVKQIGKMVGVKVTKTTVAKGASKVIPVLGGVISGTLNFASMLPMANRLHDVLDKAIFEYSNEELEMDIIEIEKVLENEEIVEEEKKIDFKKIGNSMSNGVKNIGEGFSSFIKKNAAKNKEKEKFEEIKKYKELLDTGIISQEEFDSKKKEVLGL